MGEFLDAWMAACKKALDEERFAKAAKDASEILGEMVKILDEKSAPIAKSAEQKIDDANYSSMQKNGDFIIHYSIKK